MADEIKVLSVRNGGGQQIFSLLLYFPIDVADRINDPLTSSPFVVNPTADLGADELALLSTAEQNALDAGQAVIHRTTVTFPSGTPGATMLSDVQALYSGLESKVLAVYEGRYTHAHKQFDAV